MMSRLSVLVLAVSLLPIQETAAENRTWRDSSGKLSVEAELYVLTENAVKLKKADGAVETVPVKKLSRADRRYLEQLARQYKNTKQSSKVNLQQNFVKWKLQPKAQGKRNTCSVCVTTGAFEYAFSRKHNRGLPLSVEYLNWGCNQVIGNSTKDRGQFFHDLLAGYEKYGISPERLMPYESTFANTHPSEIALQNAEQVKAAGFEVHWLKKWSKDGVLTDEQLSQIKQILRDGWPVCLGSNHSRLCVGYRDDLSQPGGGAFLVADSGGKGAFKENTYDFVKTKTFDVFWVSLPMERKDTNR
jgi:hypothetical protein